MQDNHKDIYNKDTRAEAVEEVAQIIAAIKTVLTPDFPNRIEACRTLFTSQITPQQISEDQRQTIYTMIMPYLTHPEFWQSCWELAVLLSSIIENYYDHKLGVQLYIYAFEHTTSLRHRAELFYQIRVQAFSHNIDLGVLFPDLTFQHYQDWFADAPPPPRYEARVDRAIILVSQLLQPPHAPTVDTLAKYNILHDRFGFDVAIINSNEAPYDITLPLIHYKWATRDARRHGFQVSPEGHQIYTPPCDMPTREGYQHIIDFVAEWRPAFILNFGACNFSAEHLGLMTKVITMPAGIELLPTRNSFAAVTFRPLTDGDKQMIRRCGMENVRIIDAIYNYDKPPVGTHYSRTDFRLTAEDFVVTLVGTRFDDELNEGNIALLQKVLATAPCIKLVFAGPVSPGIQAEAEKTLGTDRTRFTGFMKDVPAFYEQIADLALNPKRIGGGTSGAHALAFGVPAFTLNFGHVASLTHPDFVFNSEEELLAAIAAATEPQNRPLLRAKALEGFERVGSRERMLRTILTAADVPTDVHSPANTDQGTSTPGK